MTILLSITKKLNSYLVKCEFEVEFINFTDFMKTDYFFNKSIVNMKKNLLYYFYHVISRGR